MKITVRGISPDSTIPNDQPKLLLEFDGMGYICSIEAAGRLADNIRMVAEELTRGYKAMLPLEHTDGG